MKKLVLSLSFIAVTMMAFAQNDPQGLSVQMPEDNNLLEVPTENIAVDATVAEPIIEEVAPVATPVTPRVNHTKVNNGIAISGKDIFTDKFMKRAEKKLTSKKKKRGLFGWLSIDKLVAIIIAIFIPFLGVLLYEGEITSHFWWCLLLTFLGGLPGLIYAIIIISSN